MARVTSKENYLKLAGGGTPYYVPFFNMMGTAYKDDCAVKFISANPFNTNTNVDGGTDMFGVRYVAAEGTGGATLPEPNNFMLHDIDDWEKVVKIPKAPDIDFEEKYKKDIAAAGLDRNETCLLLNSDFMPFQQLVGFMGFEEALVSLATDPDTVKDMLNAIMDMMEPLYEHIVDVYKPDIYYILDDTAAWANPFFSLATYRDVFKPIYHRIAKPAVKRGIPIQFHNCGRCEDFYDEMIDFGVKYTDPVQTSNDIHKAKEHCKGKLSMVGGWDWVKYIPKTWPEYDEEEMRQHIRDIIDEYAPGGGFGVTGGVVSFVGDPVAKEINTLVRDEVYTYGRKFMGYTGE